MRELSHCSERAQNTRKICVRPVAGFVFVARAWALTRPGRKAGSVRIFFLQAGWTDRRNLQKDSLMFVGEKRIWMNV